MEALNQKERSFAEENHGLIQEQQNIEELLKEIMPALTERQRSHLVKLLEGKDHREITREDRVAVTEFWKDRKAIRAATTAVIRRESCGGGI